MSDIQPPGGPAGGASMDNSSTAGGAKRAADTAKQKLKGAGEAVRSEAAHFAGDAKRDAFDKADQATTQVGSTIHTFADAIRKAGDDLGEHDQTLASRIVREAADGLEGLSRALAEKRPEEMIGMVRDYGRSHPAAFVAGSVLAGLALGRLIRASERNGSAQRWSGPTADAEVNEGASMIAAPEAADPIDVDLGDEEPTRLGGRSRDAMTGAEDNAMTVTPEEAGASPAALAEGGDLQPSRGNEDQEQPGEPRRGSDIERGI